MKYKTLTINFTVEITSANKGLVRRAVGSDDSNIIEGNTAAISYIIKALDNTFFHEDPVKPISVLFNGDNIIKKPKIIINA